MKHLWTLLAGSSSTDAATNRLSIFDVLDEVTVETDLVDGDAEKATNVPLQFQVITLLARDSLDVSETGHLKVEIHGPSGLLRTTRAVEIDLQGTPRNRAMGRFSTLPVDLTARGRQEYEFRILTSRPDADDWTIAGTAVLVVDVKSESTPT